MIARHRFDPRAGAVNTPPPHPLRVRALFSRLGLSARISTVLVAACLAACSFHLPRVHKIVIQQGNVITQEMVDRLKPGMTRRQVAFVMGEPVLRNDFTPDRWDYVYSIQLPNQPTEVHRLSLFFEDEVLAYFTGDFAPTSAQKDAETPAAAPPPDPTAAAAANTN